MRLAWIILLVLIVVLIIIYLRRQDAPSKCGAKSLIPQVEVSKKRQLESSSTLRLDVSSAKSSEPQSEVPYTGPSEAQCSRLDLLSPSNLQASESGKPGTWKISWDGVEGSNEYHLDLHSGGQSKSVRVDGTSVEVELKSRADLDINLKSHNEGCNVSSVPITLHADAK